MSCIIFGTTGLCGKAILQSAEASASVSSITSVTRRPINSTNSKVKEIVEADIDKYVQVISETKPSVVFSAIATTRAAAGSAKAFVAIDHGITMKIAKAAKESGVETFVVITSAGASTSSPFLYMKTKGQIEEDLKALKFPRTIILRPGPLLGARDKPKGFLNDASAAIFGCFHNTFIGKNLIYPIFGSEVGRVAVKLAFSPKDSTTEPIVEVVGAKELLKLAAE